MKIVIVGSMGAIYVEHRLDITHMKDCQNVLAETLGISVVGLMELNNWNMPWVNCMLWMTCWALH